MNHGTIKTKRDKGYGFITQDGGPDVFFHSSELVGISFDDLQEGASVTFEIEEGEKGLSAKQVKLASDEAMPMAA